MNIPEIYLVEPYNAYAPKGRKKHWHEIVEEQALLARILAEQQAQQKAILESQTSKTLPPNSPSTATPTVGGIPQGGAGGTPVWDYWSGGAETINFSGTPTSGPGPLTVVFTNLTPTPQFDTYSWKFGDGTTSTDVNPTHTYQTGSAVGYTVQLTASHAGSPDATGSKVGYISASIPTVTASFTVITSSKIAPYTISFTNASTTTSQTAPTLTYFWLFTYNDGVSAPQEVTSSSPSAMLVVNSGSLTASLQATGSYGIASSTSSMFIATAPTLTAAFTFTTSSAIAPVTASFTDTTTYNGSGTKTYRWIFGDGTSSSLASPTHYYDTGSFTSSLQVTESRYNITSEVTTSFTFNAPTLVVAFITTSFGTGGENTYVEPVSMSYTSSNFWNGHAPVTVLWNFGSASIGGQSGTSNTIGPHYRSPYVVGSYTASLQMTGSYGLMGIYTQSFVVS